MYKVNTLACCNRRVLPLLAKKQVLKVARCFGVTFFSLPVLRNAKCIYSTVSPSLISGKQLQHVYCSTSCAIAAEHPSDSEIALNRKIMLTTTVKGQLELYKTVSDFVNVVNRVTLLFNIAKIIGKDGTQRQVLKQEKELFKQGKSSAYMDLLESIANTISHCQCRHLANVMWALGKIKEKDHRLHLVCKREILHHDMLRLNYAEICQIVNGCANLDIKAPEVFSRFQEVILAGKLRSKDLEDQSISGILLSYAKTNNGSKQFFDHFLKEIASRSMMISNRALADIVWSFAKKRIYADSLFNVVEGEIIRREPFDFQNADMVKILWAFSKADKGSKQVFYLLESALDSRGMDTFFNGELVEIVWSFAKRMVKNSKVFDLAEREILIRGVSGFRTHELVLFLYSFILAQREDVKVSFIKKIEAELCLRDANEFDIIALSQVIWSLARVNMSGSKLFDLAETEVFKINMQKGSLSGKFMLMRGFIKAQRGSNKLFQFLYSSILSRDLSDLTEAQICEFVWCFSLANVESGKLFDFLEKEILNKEKYHFTRKQLNVITKGFLRVGKGSKELFQFVTQC